MTQTQPTSDAWVQSNDIKDILSGKISGKASECQVKSMFRDHSTKRTLPQRKGPDTTEANQSTSARSAKRQKDQKSNKAIVWRLSKSEIQAINARREQAYMQELEQTEQTCHQAKSKSLRSKS
jgi:hypothetical protein